MIYFKPELLLGDLLTFAALLIASCGLFLNLFQTKRVFKQKRADYITDLHRQFTSDNDIMDVYYQIEYNRFHYDAANFHGSPEEKALDKLLWLFEYIARIYILGNVTLDDLKFIAYHYIVVYQNESVKKYLSFLDEWFEQRGISITPYQAFRDVAKELEEKFYSLR